MTVLTEVADAPLPEQPTGDQRCFVIGPLGDPHAAMGSPERRAYEESLEVYAHVISAACHNVGITAVRADEIPSAGEIAGQILRHLVTDEIVIADISGFNPNVMHELGYRHATRKFTVQIAETGQLPFNVAGIRTVRFTRAPMALIKARQELEGILLAGLKDGFGSSAVPGPHSQPIELLVPQQPTPETGEDSLGPLDKVALAEEQLDAMREDMEEISDLLQAITDVSNAYAPKIERAAQSAAPVRDRMAVFARYSQAIGPTMDRLEEATGNFDKRMVTLDAGMQVALAQIEATAPEDRDDESLLFLDQLIELAVVGRDSMASFTTMGTIAENVFSMTRILRGPAKKISSAVKHLESAVGLTEMWAQKARALR
ncbi:hypothetical protein ACWERV_07540 [Streptomyces sp. NPDC004031]